MTPSLYRSADAARRVSQRPVRVLLARRAAAVGEVDVSMGSAKTGSVAVPAPRATGCPQTATPMPVDAAAHAAARMHGIFVAKGNIYADALASTRQSPACGEADRIDRGPDAVPMQSGCDPNTARIAARIAAARAAVQNLRTRL
ncbi:MULTISPECIES: hypothetical protein [unclassified Burkholderia]|uniref:hypothetical protein n=1 Tax=unclassified Burkholderia TaxID=2613784 RepID=UPI001E4583DA|nr:MULTISPECIES: hypothetical protein [unclassified Burkholderia]